MRRPRSRRRAPCRSTAGAAAGSRRSMRTAPTSGSATRISRRGCLAGRQRRDERDRQDWRDGRMVEDSKTVGRGFEPRRTATLKESPYTVLKPLSNHARDWRLRVGLADAVGPVRADLAVEQHVRAHPEDPIARAMTVAE